MIDRVSVAISSNHKGFKFSPLAPLTSKTNIRPIAHFARLNTYGRKRKRNYWPIMCTYVVLKTSSYLGDGRAEFRKFV